MQRNSKCNFNSDFKIVLKMRDTNFSTDTLKVLTLYLHKAEETSPCIPKIYVDLWPCVVRIKIWQAYFVDNLQIIASKCR